VPGVWLSFDDYLLVHSWIQKGHTKLCMIKHAVFLIIYCWYCWYYCTLCHDIADITAHCVTVLENCVCVSVGDVFDVSAFAVIFNAHLHIYIKFDASALDHLALSSTWSLCRGGQLVLLGGLDGALSRNSRNLTRRTL